MRLDTDRQKEQEPKRIEYAVSRLAQIGIEIDYEDDKKIKFTHKGHEVTLYPYSGWFTGKSVMDGRGVENLIKQLL